MQRRRKIQPIINGKIETIETDQEMTIDVRVHRQGPLL